MLHRELIKAKFFNDIDIHFADFICRKDLKNYNLWRLAAFLSFFTNQGHSAFKLDMVNKMKFEDIFELEETDENLSRYIKYSKENVFETNKEDECISIVKIEDEAFSDVIGKSGEMKPIIKEGDLYYLNRYHQYEIIVSEFIKARTGSKDITALKQEINKLFPEDTIESKTEGKTEGEQPNWQKVAAIVALRSDFAVISGGPGTGKTTTVGRVLSLLLMQDKDLKIKMVAPTGKAADRLKESIKKFKGVNKEIEKEVLEAIPEEAETIHRFLKLKSNKNKLGRENKSPIDVLLIDEASMVSLSLFAKTFEALPDNCKVILLGDKDQLTSVENGNVLKDITNSEHLNLFSKDFADSITNITDGKLNVEIEKNANITEDLIVQLEHSYRFDEKSFIGNLSSAINAVQIEDSDEQIEKELSQIFDKQNGSLKEIDLEEFIKDFHTTHLKDYRQEVEVENLDPDKPLKALKALKALSKFRILCAINKTEYGVQEINSKIEQLWKTKGKSKTDDKRFYNGRPIIITQNDYKLNLMNGDVGVILNSETGLKAYFPNNASELKDGINPASLGEHATAFALSIHKSQGSEFDKVHIILPAKDNKILNKELIYTAITRAKEDCVIYSTMRNLIKAIKQDNHRISGLTKKLQ